MAKQNKIQVSTVKIEANAEVIVLNSSFVAKAMRAQFALQDAKQHMACAAEDRCKPVIEFLDELVGAMLGEESPTKDVEPSQMPIPQGKV